MKRFLSVTLLILSLLFSLSVSPVFAAEHVVTNLDGGFEQPGSLRNVLLTVVPGDLITFQDGLRGVINLTGQIWLTHDITIQGPGSDVITLSGFFPDPASLIAVGQGVNAQISGLSFANANAGIQNGAAISNAGNLRLSDCLFHNNQAARGGAIFNATEVIDPVASMDIVNCQFLSNQADWGGAILNEGNLLIQSSDFTGNQSLNGNGGAIFNYYGGNLELRKCNLSSNTMTSTYMDGGGAIANYESMVLDSCVLENNHALNNRGGGAIYSYHAIGGTFLTNCTLKGNSAGSGGAIRNQDAENYHSEGISLSLINCILAENQAYKDVGGAISSNADHNKVVLNNCIVRDNTAFTSGGGIHYGNNTLEMVNCTVSRNISQGGGSYPVNTGGGGIYTTSLGSYVYLHNCTISGNVASSDIGLGGGGIYYNSSDSNLRCINCTITDNYAFTGAGISGRNIQLKNTVLAGNRGDDLYKSHEIVSSYGYNLIGNVSRDSSTSEFIWESVADIVSADIESADIFAVILADNGGPLVGAPGGTEQILTLALKPGSPAIDQAANTDIFGSPIVKDQRGVSRPQGDYNDIGAFERELVSYSIATTVTAGGTIDPVSADVPEGADQTFTITPYDGYILNDLLNSEESVSADMAGNDYTFTNVVQNDTLNAAFIIDPAMKEEAGVGDFQVENEGIGSITSDNLVDEEDIASLNMGGISSGDVEGLIGDEGADTNNFVSGFSFDVNYSDDEGNDIFALDVTLDISREDLGQDICETVDAGNDLAVAFFENISIYKIVSPDAFDLFEVASEDHEQPVNFFEVTSDDSSYHVSMSMVIEDNETPGFADTVEAVEAGMDSYFYVYDGVADGKFTDPLVAVSKTSETPPVEDGDNTAINGGDGCNFGLFSPMVTMILLPLLFLLRK